MNLVCYSFIGAVDDKGKKSSFKNPTAARFLDKEQWLKTVRTFNGSDLMDLNQKHFMGSNLIGAKVHAIANLRTDGGVPIYVESSTYNKLKNLILPYKDLF